MAGGPRVGAGHPADPNALRRERKSDTIKFVHLPAARREDEPPPIPLPHVTQRERVLWTEEWARPQAAMWADLGLEREVALYIRALRMVETAKAPVHLRTLVRQYMDGLGISMRGLAERHWIIDPPVAEGPPAPEPTPDAASDRDRFLHVVGNAG